VTLAQEWRETRQILAALWRVLPEALRGPTQFQGRQYAGCGATIGVMPRCDFACAGCYLGAEANQAAPRPVAEIRQQLDQLRQWLGPGGNVQITDGEVSLRDEAEVVAILRHAKAIGLVPMLMSHGETFRRCTGLLERLITGGGLTELSLHVDTTMRGRRDRFASVRTEAELNPLRTEFAGMIRAARRRTGRRLEVASTVTVTEDNLDGVPDIIRWFLANADAFKMVSFQPVAAVGRTRSTLGGVTVEALWDRIAKGAGAAGLESAQGWLGHPACSRFVQGLAGVGCGQPRYAPLYRRDDPGDMALLKELLDRLGGLSFRRDGPGRALRRALWMLGRHGTFLTARVVPHLLRTWARSGVWRPRYFCIVSHHFMNAAELETPTGRERLAACAFRVPVDGRLEPMCAVNALGIRERHYAGAHAGAARSA